MKFAASTVLSLFVFAVFSLSMPQIGVGPGNNVTLKDVTDRKFHVGDVWEYKTRPGESHSRLTIVKIDQSPKLGTVVHVGVDHVRFKNCRGGPAPEALSHMPFARQALVASVTKRVASNQPLPDYREGYEEWVSAYSRKSAGVYVIGVADAVSVAEKTFQHGIGCD